jgi:O-antigen/teichoic acid export membrane protein
MPSSRTSKVFALSLGQGLTTLISLVSGMVMTRILSQTELATYRQTMLAYEIALPLLGLGVSQGIYYFLPTEKRRARGLVVDGLVMMLVMGVMYGVFIALGGNHILAKRFSNPAIVNTLVYLVPLPIVMLPAGLLASVMVVQEKVKILTIYNVLTSLILTSSVIAGCLLWKTPEAMILVRVGVTVLTGVVAIALIIQALPRDDWRPRLGNMKTMVAFSIPLVLAGAIGTISLQLDKIIVSSMCSPEEFAVYSTGALEIPLIGIVTGSISSVMVVDFRKAFAAGNYSEALSLYRLVPAKSTILLFPVMVYLAIAAKPFIIVLFSEKYTASILPFMLYLLMIPNRTILLGGMAAVGKSKIVLRITVVSLLINMVLSVILVYAIGYMGAVLGTVLTLFFWSIPIALYEIACSLNTSMRDVYPWATVFRSLLYSLIPAIPTAVILWILRNNYYLMQLIVTSIVYALSYLAVLSWAGKIDIRRDAAKLWARHFT